MCEVILLKLISGEEIIGTVEKEEQGKIYLKNAVSITYHPTEDGKMSAGFAPHMPYAEGIIILWSYSIAFSANVKEEMLNEYKRIFGEIIVPKPGLQIAK